MPLPMVPQPDLRTAPEAGIGARLGPLDEDDRALEVALEITPLGVGHAIEATQIQVGHVGVAGVAMADRVRRARDRGRRSEPSCRATDERSSCPFPVPRTRSRRRPARAPAQPPRRPLSPPAMTTRARPCASLGTLRRGRNLRPSCSSAGAAVADAGAVAREWDHLGLGRRPVSGRPCEQLRDTCEVLLERVLSIAGV